MIDQKLITFLKLCELMNYRKTAEALHLTQPAVLNQIKQLEQVYQCKLFLYDKKRLHKTTEAAMLEHYVENLIYQESQFIQALSSHNNKRFLHIGATKTIGEYVIKNQVSQCALDKDNQISVTIDNTKKLLSYIDKGLLDFALVEGFFDQSKYQHIEYANVPFIGVCHKDHPFANKVISLNDIFYQHLLIREEGSGTRDILERMLIEHNHTINEFERITSINHFSLLIDVLKRINGITFAYEPLIRNDDELACFTIKGLNISHSFNYVFLDNDYSRDYVLYFNSLRKQ